MKTEWWGNGWLTHVNSTRHGDIRCFYPPLSFRKWLAGRQIMYINNWRWRYKRTWTESSTVNIVCLGYVWKSPDSPWKSWHFSNFISEWTWMFQTFLTDLHFGIDLRSDLNWGSSRFSSVGKSLHTESVHQRSCPVPSLFSLMSVTKTYWNSVNGKAAWLHRPHYRRHGFIYLFKNGGCEVNLDVWGYVEVEMTLDVCETNWHFSM